MMEDREQQQSSGSSQVYKTFKYKVCPHCDKELNLKIFREHKRLYYDSHRKKWCREERKECSIRSSDESELSGFEFEGIDRSETVIANEKELDLGECFADEGMSMNMKPVILLSRPTASSEGRFSYKARPRSSSRVLKALEAWGHFIT